MLECAAEASRSYNWAQRSHLSAIRVHTVLFSGLRVNLAMSSHSAANLKNFSDGFMGWALSLTDPFDNESGN
jgi:hypothetical protein